MPLMFFLCPVEIFCPFHFLGKGGFFVPCLRNIFPHKSEKIFFFIVFKNSKMSYNILSIIDLLFGFLDSDIGVKTQRQY